MGRKVVDCRDYPSESGCSLTIAGEEDEVLKAASQHAVAVHGEKDSPELMEKLRSALKDEEEVFGAMSARKEERGAPMESRH